MKTKKLLKASGYTALLFLAICLFCLTTLVEGFLGKLYSLFLADFSIGFCSRLLIGEILGFFKDSFTYEWMTDFALYSTLAVFLLAAFYMGKTLSDAEKTTSRTIFLFIFFFISTPLSIATYYGITFGFLDIFLLAIFLLTAFFGDNKYLLLTIPLLLFAGVMIHESFIFSYMAPCLGLVAYYAIKKYKKSIYSSVMFVVSSLAAFATSVYSVLFSRVTVKMTEQQMLEYLAKKGNCEISDVIGYMESFIFFKDTIGEYGAEYGENIFDVGKYMIELAAGVYSGEQIMQTIAVLPVLALVFYVWVKAIRNSKGFMEKVPYILFMLTPIPQIIAATLISMDFSRFFATIVITQLFYLFVCANKKDSAVMPSLEKMNGNLLYFALPFAFLMISNIKE